jgi:ATP-dependent Clp protease ATP-binding subunit ClpC
MTSNLGTEFVKKSGSLGFLRKGDDGSGEDQNNEKIEKALKATFRPEFLNRIDEIITFKPLTVEDVEKIVNLQMKEIQERLSESNVTVKLTDTARKWLAREGYDPAFGARPLRRALQRHVESPLSVQMLKGDVKSGDTVTVDYVEGEGVKFIAGDLPVKSRKSKKEEPAEASV